MPPLANTEKTQSDSRTCPVCDSSDLERFIEILGVPVHSNVLWPSQQEALHAQKGDIHLSHCKSCGHIYNIAFNPALVNYGPEYETSLHFSPRFQHYAEFLAHHLIDKYDLHGKTIIEIACGKGDFLRLICQLGDNYGIGFDPSYEPNDARSEDAKNITFVQDYFSQDYPHYVPDFICCRHALEHIDSPREFLLSVRAAINGHLNTVVFFEVPNVMFTLKHLGIWDLIYEHRSYFSARSLARVFSSTGFEVTSLRQEFDAQFLCIEAFPAKGESDPKRPPSSGFQEVGDYIATFATRYYSKLEHWRRELQNINHAGKKAVVWGGGSKGVTFLNVFKDRHFLQYVVDINPRKHGTYVPGTGQEIVAPGFLKHYRPDTVIIMNSIYLEEVKQLLKDMNLHAGFMVA